MKGRSSIWLEEMHCNKICQWCPAAVSENKAVLGAHQIKINQIKEDKHNLKRTVFPDASEKLTLLQKQVCGSNRS